MAHTIRRNSKSSEVVRHIIAYKRQSQKGWLKEYALS